VETTTSARSAGATLTALAQAIDARDWDGLAALLAPAFIARYAHTGESFDSAQFVALNRDYPGAWSFRHETVIDAGDAGAMRARVFDATGSSDEVHYVAGFAKVDGGGLLTELVEVWAEVVPPVSGDRRPSTAVGDPA
jgi:hypothetical protein